MNSTVIRQIVPPQQKGASSVTRDQFKCRDEEDARRHFQVSASRLYNVNAWHTYAGKGTAEFQLVNALGERVNRQAHKGDYFRINIPAPDNPDSDGEDWVQVEDTGEKTNDQFQLAWMTVRAALNPVHSPNKATHFFDRHATSTFIVCREGTRLTAAVYGRNERANVQSRNWLTRVRNWLVYLGAQMGLAKLQWKNLTNGLLKPGS